MILLGKQYNFQKEKENKSANEQVKKGKPRRVLPWFAAFLQRDVEVERNLNGCKSLASDTNLEYMETKAAFKGCSQQCQTLLGREQEEEEVARPWCSIFCHFS